MGDTPPPAVPLVLQPTDAIEFLGIVTPPTGYWNLVAIRPEDGKIVARAFTRATISDTVAWIIKHEKWNQYWSTNPLKTALNKKATKADVAAMRWVHLDRDDPSDAALAVIRGLAPAPTLILLSGGGYQAFWRLREPVPIAGYAPADKKLKTPEVPGNVPELEAANWSVLKAAGEPDEGTRNIDRIMRLPGTINWPTETKFKKNPNRKPVLAKLIEHHPERVYGLTDFAALPGGAVARQPKARKKSEGSTQDRSRDLYRKVAVAIRAGKNDDEIIATYKSHPHAADQADPERAVQRCIDDVREKIAEEIATALGEMNAAHAVINWRGRVAILSERIDPESRRPSFELMSPADLKYWYANKFVNGKSQSDWWLKHPERRQYSGVAFAPGRDLPGVYNLWRGFGPLPKAGDCSLWLAMVREVICSRDERLYDYVIAWCADAVQRPTDRPGVVLVLRGPQGIGKGTFAIWIGKLFGAHFLHIRSARHLVGNFNAHLSNVLLLFADEAFWAGDKQSEGALKGLVTEPTIPIEFKGKDVINVQNYLRIIIASNQEWVVPTAMEDRRFTILDVSSAHMQDIAYFGAIKQQMEAGGAEALLDYLLKYDLKGVELRKIPDTEARRDQQDMSMDPFLAFWKSRLEDVDGWVIVVPTADLWDAYKKTTVFPVNDVHFGRRIKKLFPTSRKVRAIIDRARDKRVPVYHFPTIEDARKSFETYTHRTVEWEVLEETDIAVPTSEDF